VAAAEELSAEVVYAGMSLGAMPAQKLAQTRPGARGAVLLHAAVPPEEFGGPWPEDVPLQIHLMEEDELALEGDLDAARELKATAGAELCLYPGDRHLFTDSSLPDYHEHCTMLVLRHVTAFLEATDGGRP
jgi:dienelactone hydrolase